MDPISDYDVTVAPALLQTSWSHWGIKSLWNPQKETDSQGMVTMYFLLMKSINSEHQSNGRL